MSIHRLFLLINLVRPSIHFSVKVGFSNFWERRSWSLCWYMCNCWLLWSSRCQCWRWNDWRPIFHAPRTHSGFFCSMFFDILSFFLLIHFSLRQSNYYLNTHCYYVLQSFLAGLAASGTLTSVMRIVTKAAFEKSENGLRKGASMWIF